MGRQLIVPAQSHRSARGVALKKPHPFSLLTVRSEAHAGPPSPCAPEGRTVAATASLTSFAALAAGALGHVSSGLKVERECPHDNVPEGDSRDVGGGADRAGRADAGEGGTHPGHNEGGGDRESTRDVGKPSPDGLGESTPTPRQRHQQSPRLHDSASAAAASSSLVLGCPPLSALSTGGLRLASTVLSLPPPPPVPFPPLPAPPALPTSIAQRPRFSLSPPAPAGAGTRHRRRHHRHPHSNPSGDPHAADPLAASTSSGEVALSPGVAAPPDAPASPLEPTGAADADGDNGGGGAINEVDPAMVGFRAYESRLRRRSAPLIRRYLAASHSHQQPLLHQPRPAPTSPPASIRASAAANCPLLPPLPLQSPPQLAARGDSDGLTEQSPPRISLPAAAPTTLPPLIFSPRVRSPLLSPPAVLPRADRLGSTHAIPRVPPLTLPPVDPDNDSGVRQHIHAASSRSHHIPTGDASWDRRDQRLGARKCGYSARAAVSATVPALALDQSTGWTSARGAAPNISGLPTAIAEAGADPPLASPRRRWASAHIRGEPDHPPKVRCTAG